MAFALTDISQLRCVFSVVEIAKSSVSSIMARWQGRVALVTGASEGIGAAICEKLVKEGMTVLGCARTSQKIEELAKELKGKGSGKFVAYRCDMSKEKDILNMYDKIREDKYTPIHVCINNAATIINSSLIDGNARDWKEMLDVGILGVCINTREAIKMMTGGCGHIIHMGGITGHKIPTLGGKLEKTPKSDLNFYHAMKFMIRALAEGLRQEIRDKENLKIRVSTISPGSVKTGLLAKASTAKEADEYFEKYKCLQPKDVADAVIFVLSAPDHVNVHDIVMEPVAFQV